ncbi:hypothetical protein [Rossellomorea aquimaris]|uniref:hypothetical protein n=1 Tax=Rossellomorea aquimaris TaxID=189382 RepID=UPI0011E93CEF|nr:hypothetical protein [Rossellomorea aquimaris]TYS91895.1 hypothetical protein FZC88_07110 [Rossellomorea aquimaris]
MGLDIETGAEVLAKAKENIAESRVWEQWLSVYPNMEEETFIPYSKYLEELKKPPKKQKTDEEVIQDAENILKNMKHSK